MKPILLFTALALSAGPALAAGAGDHSHDHGFTFGEPGDPAKVNRTVEIAMSETDDGAMIFEPNDLAVGRGETVRIKLVNKGELDHELVLATREENDKHAMQMMKHPDMEHDDPNGRRLAPGASDEIVWHFSKAGTFDFACLIPGHRGAGMHGSVAVK